MGHSRKRVGVDGKPRYTAYYDDLRGRRRSAGTYPSRKDADHAWQTAETDLRAGRPGDPATGRITFTSYVRLHWFPHHILEPTTRESYRYNLHRHITPWFGPMKMADILPVHVREWVSDLINHGVTPATIRHQKIILSAIFTTALNDYVITLHPCKGVKTPTVPVKEYRILSPDEIARLLLALPNDPARLLVETAIGSGLRWGELIELRPRDLHTGSRPTPRPRLLAACRRRRPTGRPRTTRPPIHHHHGEIPPHPPHRRHHRTRRTTPHPSNTRSPLTKGTRIETRDNRILISVRRLRPGRTARTLPQDQL